MMKMIILNNDWMEWTERNGMDEWKNEWVTEWIDRWMDGWMAVFICDYLHCHLPTDM